MKRRPPSPLRWFFAAVWLVNGVACKVFDLVPRHQEIVARILGEEHSLLLTRLIGFSEVIMAAWIISGIRARWSAVAQMAAVAAMNVLEFFIAPDLLLFGGWNALVALAYIALVGFDEFKRSHPS
ncbi:MAG: DoxX-like family protein [Verrucomicrobiota bacterium]